MSGFLVSLSDLGAATEVFSDAASGMAQCRFPVSDPAGWPRHSAAKLASHQMAMHTDLLTMADAHRQISRLLAGAGATYSYVDSAVAR